MLQIAIFCASNTLVFNSMDCLQTLFAANTDALKYASADLAGRVRSRFPASSERKPLSRAIGKCDQGQHNRNFHKNPNNSCQRSPGMQPKQADGDSNSQFKEI